MPTITPPFQRRITNPLQRPVAADLNLQAFYDSVTQSYLAGAIYSASPGGNPTFTTGFIGNSFRCFASTTSREVAVQKGLGFINASTAYDEDDISGIAGVNAGSYAPVVCQPDDPDAAGLNVPVDELAAGLQRIDLVCVKAPNYPTATANIGLLNPTSSTFAFAPRPTQFTENAFTVTAGDPDFIKVVAGTPSAGTPTVPTVPTGYVEIGRVYVPVGAANLANSDIEDRRPVLIPHGGRAMTLSFLTSITTTEVLGFDFGNNGVHAAVRKVVDGSNRRWFEVYVASGATNPSVFQMVAGGWAALDGTGTPTNTLQGGAMTAVYSEETVSRASALPIFEAAGTYDALIGPTVRKFVVLAGFLDKSGVTDNCVINIDDTSGLNANVRRVRLSLYAQSF
jgi:hypothetical protein